MAKGRLARQLRLGLQIKAIVVLAVVVVGVALAGGWFYFATTRDWLHQADEDRARQLARALSVAAEADLRARRYVALDQLVCEQVGQDGVVYAAVVNAHGQVVASADKGDRARRWPELLELPLDASRAAQTADGDLLLACPIRSRDALFWTDRIAGAIRLVVDTRATTARLAGVQRHIWTVAACLILCSIPVGYLLVWRVMVRPVHRLVGVTRRLGQGDFSARAALRRSDEIGMLAGAFDKMADEVAAMRDELIQANERLEQKVAERTGQLEVANERLREEISEKEDFLRAVSHDLNAPLRNIAGMATMIMTKWRRELPEEVTARLQRIQSNVDAETSLIGELLELSRIRTRTQTRQMTDMARLVGELARTFEYELKSRRIALTVARDMPELYVEPNRMRQVFQNLIDNAVKYMDKADRGRIDVGYRRAGEYHRFRVADNGPGIPEDQRERIFHVFRRGRTDAAGKIEGKGVGLALVRSVAAKYGGRAWVESEPGRGATFFVTLSAAATAPPAESPAADAPAGKLAAPAGS